MQDFIDDYIKQGAAEGWTPKTVKTYRDRLEHLARHLGAKRPVDVRPADLQGYMTGLRDAGWKRSGRRTLASTVRNFFAWLAAQGRILSNPTRTLKVEREDETELPDPPLAVAELDALLNGLPKRNAIDLRDRALLELLYGCGLRLSEAIALDLRDIDQTTRTVNVREGKGRKSRELPAGRGAMYALRDWLALRRSLLKGPDHGALFLDRKGRRIRDIHVWHLFKKLNRARGPDARRLHPHLLRHSIAVHLLQNGADIRYVQKFLGHEKLDTTKIYLRLVPGRLKEDYEAAMPVVPVAPPPEAEAHTR